MTIVVRCKAVVAVVNNEKAAKHFSGWLKVFVVLNIACVLINTR